jgi:predicted RNase H-like HicB family nuclease
VSFSPSLPGAVSQGRTVEQALENLREAIAGCVESYRAGGERVPWVADPDFQGDAAFRGWIDVDV